MKPEKSQKELFQNKGLSGESLTLHQALILSKEVLINWQNKIHTHQSKLFQGSPNDHKQGSLFKETDFNPIDGFNPLNLKPLALGFWRMPDNPHDGPAIYLVIDRIEGSNSPILLYVGETIAANRRWKGEHDCKNYLANYCDALVNAGMSHQLSIRFWADVPVDTRSRRYLEQQLIQRWLPPFNKETRSLWNTPFTCEVG